MIDFPLCVDVDLDLCSRMCQEKMFDALNLYGFLTKARERKTCETSMEDLKSTGMRFTALPDSNLGELKACDMQYIFTFSSAEEALIYFQKPCINAPRSALTHCD